MSKQPVILSYFAQSPDQQHLAMLVDEESAIKGAWEEATQNDRNPVNVAYFSRDGREATVQKVMDDITKYSDRIVMFHFSGHAGHDELWLNDGAGGPDGIAGLLEQYAINLKIVVLNGCSTRKQVNTFFGRGIPVVVATQCAVKDAHAKQFATTFHETLCQNETIEFAYKAAILKVKGIKDLDRLLPKSVEETFIVVRGGMLDTSRQTDKIWGLYVQETKESFLNDPRWRDIEYKMGGKAKINPEKAYVLERDKADYINTFYEYFDPLKPNCLHIQHYLVVGQRAESPLGLIRKFFYDKVLQPRDQETLNFESYYYSFIDFPGNSKVVELDKEDISDVRILHKLLSLVKGSRPAISVLNLTTADDLCAEFFGCNYFKLRQYVLIAFRMPPEDLTNITTRAILDTITRLNGWVDKLPERPSFLFFWTIEQERSWLNMFLDSPLRKLISRFDMLTVGPLAPRLCVINKDGKFLKTPRPTDIDDWVNRKYGKDIADDLRESLHKQKNVETLEIKLLKLIEEANAKPA